MIEQFEKQNVFVETHAEEIDDIIRNPPHWIFRWGITTFFFVFASGLAACWFIHYPDVIRTKFTLMPVKAPVSVVARIDGRITRLAVQNDQFVEVGNNLAFFESTADPQQVLRLEKLVRNIVENLKDKNWNHLNLFEQAEFSNLGELQIEYQTFLSKLAELQTFLPSGLIPKKKVLLFDDLHDLSELEAIIKEEIELQQKDVRYAEDEQSIHEKLFMEKIISSLEYKREMSKILSRKMPIKVLSASLIQNRTAQNDKRKEILDIDNSISEHKDSFIHYTHNLLSHIEEWKQKYIVAAPVGGKISFSLPWLEDQHIFLGQELFIIEPVDSRFKGIIHMSQANSGKIHVGQKVFVKLDGYPYKEFGTLDGKLVKLSLSPDRDSLYWGDVELPGQLITSYGDTLTYMNSLKGTANVITKDRKLIERLVSTFRLD
jgi:multidrug resistance efflux pump